MQYGSEYSGSPYGGGYGSGGYDRSAYSHAGHGHGGGRRRRKKKTPLFVALGIVIALVAVVAVCGGLLFSSARRVMSEARSLSSAVGQLQTAISDKDGDALQQATGTLRSGVDALQEELDGPLWNIASFLPVIGGDISGARTLLSIADGLVGDALEPASTTLAAYPLDTLMSGSSINTEALQQYCSLVSQIEPAIDTAAERVDTLGTFRISQLNDVVDQLREPLATASELLDAYGPLIQQIPEILGCNGSRTYLIIAQCNSEVRATGGFPGAWGILTVENGQATLGGFTTISGRREVTFDLTDEEVNLFGDGMAISPGNLNCTPDYPRAATLLASAWEAYMGQAVDGVFAMDPVFLQDILGLVGNVTASDGTVVDGTNAAWVLSSDVYWRYGEDPDMQDAFFAEVAGLVADRVMEDLGAIDLGQLLDVVGRDADEGRLLLWFRNTDTEAALDGMDIAGALPSDPSKPELGVYVNDNTWGKMAWYLLMNTAVTGSTTNADGTVTYDVTTTLTNSFTLEEAAVAPAYIIGYSPSKRSTDDLFINALLVAPAGGTISNVTASNGAAAGEAALYGHDVWRVDVNLYAQETVTISYQVTVAAGAEELEIHQTPLAQRQ